MQGKRKADDALAAHAAAPAASAAPSSLDSTSPAPSSTALAAVSDKPTEELGRGKRNKKKVQTVPRLEGGTCPTWPLSAHGCDGCFLPEEGWVLYIVVWMFLLWVFPIGV